MLAGCGVTVVVGLELDQRLVAEAAVEATPLDEEWSAGVDDEASLHGSEGVTDHPRYAAMSLAAHGVHPSETSES